MTLNAEITTKDKDINTKKLTVVRHVGREIKNKIEHRELQIIFSTERQPQIWTGPELTMPKNSSPVPDTELNVAENNKEHPCTLGLYFVMKQQRVISSLKQK